MQIVREHKSRGRKEWPWAHFHHNKRVPLGENGEFLTGSQKHIDLSRRIAQEGMVLLENDGILPLKDGVKLALFGIGSVDYVPGGGGSGVTSAPYERDIYEGFQLKGDRVKVFEPLNRFYCDCVLDYLKDNYSMTAEEYEHVNDTVPEPEVPEDLLQEAAAFADVAILVIHRYSTEGWDRTDDLTNFHLTDSEVKLIDRVTAACQNVVAVFNTGGAMDLRWIREKSSVRAALMAWQSGQEGGLAIADILMGDANPCGKLVDTFAKTLADYPSTDSYFEDPRFVHYYEDIYVGYRYFDTIPGAADKVMYPFGYGLSYTTFALSAPTARLNGEDIEVTVTVENTGSVPGKEVVQVYYSAPQGKLGKPAHELAAFAKTKELAPGEQQTLTMAFPVSSMASYDDLGKCRESAYVLEGGQYRFYAGNCLTDLQKADYEYTVDGDFVVTEQLTRQAAPSQLKKRMLADGTFEEYPSFPPVYHNHQDYENTAKAPDKKVVFLLKDVTDGMITLDEFLSVLTDEELVKLACGTEKNRGVAITSGLGYNALHGIPAMMTADGPAGLHFWGGTGVPTTAWPCSTQVACTWNTELVYEMGQAAGSEVWENAIAFWLAPGMNIHRNPLCGRNFEYYSEDPLLTGKVAAALVKGVQSKGVSATPKHFACNNREENRINSDSRVSERALREIYLKGFEICVKEANPLAIMTAYNIVNGIHAMEHYELITNILRGEWGFQGVVMSDWGGYADPVNVVRAGGDVRMPVGDADALLTALRLHALTRGQLEQCVKHLLQTIIYLSAK